MDGLMLKIKNKLNSKDKKIILLVIASCAAMLVILLSEFMDFGNKPAENGGNSGGEEAVNYNTEFKDYQSELEKKIVDLISSVNGAGNVKVLLTIECFEEYVYAKDSEKSENISPESRIIEENDTYIVIDNDKLSAKGGMLLKIVTPRVRGVGIVCDGGDSPLLRKEITDILCAALSIGASQVHITK